MTETDPLVRCAYGLGHHETRGAYGFGHHEEGRGAAKNVRTAAGVWERPRPDVQGVLPRTWEDL
jgi:hypothetical protein